MAAPTKPLHAPGAVRRARRLRSEMTASERRLWKELRKLELHIRRQAPIGRYIADFAQHEARMVIEVDGARHDLDEAQLHDAERDAWLVAQGYRVIRVRDSEALEMAEEVAARIGAEIRKALEQAEADTP
jgi:very-short-patch-repair endonuclease